MFWTSSLGRGTSSLGHWISIWDQKFEPSSLQKMIDLVFSGGRFEDQLMFESDGTMNYAEVMGYPYKNKAGKVLLLVLVIRNITEKKDLEMQVIRSQRLQSIGTLASGIAHDLNNILTPFTMAVNVLAPKLKSDPAALKILRLLESNSSRGSDLIKQILTFARGVKGTQSECQLKFIINEIEELILEVFPKTIRIETDISNNCWKILGDATQIHQVLLNKYPAHNKPLLFSYELREYLKFLLQLLGIYSNPQSLVNPYLS